MKKLTFKNKKEFAKAIMEYSKLYDKNNNYVTFDFSFENPFRFNKEESMHTVWEEYNKEWYTEQPLQDKDLVMCWDDSCEVMIDIRFYDAKNQVAFGVNGSRDDLNTYDNYKKLNPLELPKSLKEWYDKAVKLLED